MFENLQSRTVSNLQANITTFNNKHKVNKGQRNRFPTTAVRHKLMAWTCSLEPHAWKHTCGEFRRREHVHAGVAQPAHRRRDQRGRGPPQPLPLPQACIGRWCRWTPSPTKVGGWQLLSRSSNSISGVLAPGPETRATCTNRGPFEGSCSKTRTNGGKTRRPSHPPTGGGTFCGDDLYHPLRLKPG